ncbi:MAG TPA: CHAT domain-containing tetratricopeptide repeat protein [Nitrososphaeraceae archaeon]|nr:CHAT domain-containing tetratricopeptide repeat protein [Nitrososphaeraceae archaeon]
MKRTLDEEIDIIIEMIPFNKDNPDRLMTLIEKSPTVAHLDKGILFYNVGQELYSFFNSAFTTDRNLAMTYYRLAPFFWKRALMHFDKANDTNNKFDCCMALGIFYFDEHDSKGALSHLERALELAKEMRDASKECVCHLELGSLLNEELSYYSEALSHLERALELAKEIGDSKLETQCNFNLGLLYDNLRNHKEALVYLERAKEGAKIWQNELFESKCYSNLGLVNNHLENYDKALMYFEKAADMKKRLYDKRGEQVCYSGMGWAQYRKKDYDSGLNHYEHALDLAREIGDQLSQSDYYGSIGHIYTDKRDWDKALAYFEKAREYPEKLGDLNRMLQSNYGFARVYNESCNYGFARGYNESKNLELAKSYLSRAIDLYEFLGKRLSQNALQQQFFANDRSKMYTSMIYDCWNLQERSECFEYIERSKSKSFIDMLSSKDIHPSVSITEKLAGLLQEEQKYLDKKQQMERTFYQEKFRDTETISTRLDEIYREIEKIDPMYVSLRKSKYPTVEQIHAMMDERSNPLIVEYFVTSDDLFIFAISPSEMIAKKVPLTYNRLSDYVENYEREVMYHQMFEGMGDTWQGLSAYLIEPIIDLLGGKKLIYFVPHSLIHYLPLHALNVNGAPLIHDHPVIYSPSTSVLQYLRNRPKKGLKTCASFGVEFLEEAKQVASIFNVNPKLEVSKDEVLESLNYDILHFACHGYYDHFDPLSSGLVLGHGQKLTAREILNQKLSCELTTLSACMTGVNSLSRGDELIGLTRAFLYAGASSLIVSLWMVNDRSTTDLMIDFYKLLKDGKDKATAWQCAQKNIMKKEEYSHPYYWAPFILIGD